MLRLSGGALRALSGKLGAWGQRITTKAFYR